MVRAIPFFCYNVTMCTFGLPLFESFNFSILLKGTLAKKIFVSMSMYLLQVMNICTEETVTDACASMFYLSCINI